MSSPSRSLLAGAILFVASLTAAEAADLGGNRDLSYAPMPAAFAPSPTWYLRGDVGYAWMDASDLAANSFTFSSVSIDNAWGLGVALMAGLSCRFDRQAPVSTKDTPVAATVPGRLYFDIGYRFLYLGDASTGHAVGVAAPTPGPRLEDITAHEFRIGLRYDLR